MTFWSETWPGGGGAWPAGWSTAGTPGASAATVVGGQGRLAAGPGTFAAARARFDRMERQRDVNLLVSFTPTTSADWNVTLGTRTQSNAPAFDNHAFTPRGMYVQLYNFLGTGLIYRRWDDSGWYTDPATVTSGLPVLTSGTSYTARLLLEGRRLRFRVWATASAEPSTWALDFTDPDAYMTAGKVTVAFQTGEGGAVQQLDVDNLTVAGLDPVMPSVAVPERRHEWSMFSRDASYATDLALPILSAKFVRRHMGVSTAVVSTSFTPERWTSLGRGRGVVLYRDGRQEFTGRITGREAALDQETGQATIKVEAKGDEVLLADRLSFPDPLRAADDQIVNDYWMSRTGATATAKVASTAMLQLISDQAGATCRVDRRITGLTLGPDPAVGLSRVWSALFTPVLDQLTIMSVSSGANLGLRMASAAGALTATIVQSRDLTQAVKFSADLSNLVGFTYREEAPEVTHALAAGQGDLHLRLRKLVATTDPLALSWGRQIWLPIDRRDTADVAELTKAGEDALADGGATVSLAVSLTDSQAGTYGLDWDLGDAITVYVGLPGQTKVAAVSDVCREIAFEVDANSVERITPAIGTYDAKAVIPTPTQKKLAEVASGLSGLITRK